MHRGGENSMDVSADLVELGKTPMAGISAKLNGLASVILLFECCS